MKRRVSSVVGEERRVFDGTTTSSGALNVHHNTAANMASNNYNQLKSERRKVRKVLVERKRRERIDRCLDQLKLFLQDSAVPATSNQQIPTGSHIDSTASLEKADILELTVNHLRALRSRRNVQRAYGYSACAQEVDAFLAQAQYDDRVRQRMMFFLASRQAQLMHDAQMSGEDDEGEKVPTNENDPRAASIVDHCQRRVVEPTAATPVDNRSRSADFFTNNTLAAYYTYRPGGPHPAVDDQMLAGAQRIATAAFDYYAANAANDNRRMTFMTSPPSPLSAADQYTHLSMCSGVAVPTPLAVNTLYDSTSRHGNESSRPRGRTSTSSVMTSSPMVGVGLTSAAQNNDDVYSGNNNSIQSSDIDTTSLMTSNDDVAMMSVMTSPEDVGVTSHLSMMRGEASAVGLQRRLTECSQNKEGGYWSQRQTSSSSVRGGLAESRLADSVRWSESENINIVSDSDSLKREPLESEIVWRPW